MSTEAVTNSPRSLAGRPGAGVGRSLRVNPFEAGRAAAEAAMAELGGGEVGLVMVFGTAGYDQGPLLKGVGSVFSGVPMVGCSGEGIITQEGSDESSHSVAVMAVAGSPMAFDTFHAADFKASAKACAHDLAAQIGGCGREDGRVLILFPDGLTGNATELVDELSELLPDLLMVGGTAGDMFSFEECFQYHDGEAHSDSVSAVLISGNVRPEIAVSHGCDPIGLERVITRAEGSEVLEIDGLPAWDVLKEYLDDDPDDLASADLIHLCFGERIPEEHRGSYGEHALRTPFGHDKERGSLYFPGQLKTGTVVQMTRRDPQRICQSVTTCAEAFIEHEHEAPLLVLHFDCAGRGRIIFGETTEAHIIDPLQNILGRDVPWIGFHSYGEIAPLGSKTYFHNYTVALCALYPGRD